MTRRFFSFDTCRSFAIVYVSEGRSFRNRRGIAIVEALIALCVIGVLAGVVISRYQRVTTEARATAVKTELTNVRTAVMLFKMLNGRNPDNLREMIDKNVILPARIGIGYSGSFFKQKYLLANAVNDRGDVMDAYGNALAYDPTRGEVRSTTRGCETW
jgi:type II secretory pathway pseudopilin PulG